MGNIYGRISVFFFSLFLLLSTSSYGITDLQLENLLAEFEMNYNMLLSETQVLKKSFREQRTLLQNSQTANEELKRSLNEAERSLNEQMSISENLKTSLQFQISLSEELKKSLTEASESSKKAEDSYKKGKIKAYLIGGAVGIILGGIIAGTIVIVVK